MQSSPKAAMGILTADPDAPGLKPCIQQLVARADLIGMHVYWIREGWGGLLSFTPTSAGKGIPPFISLNSIGGRKRHRFSNACLHQPRASQRNKALYPHTAPSASQGKTKSKGKKGFTERVKEVLDMLGIEVLVAIGGDETLSLALQMDRAGVPVVAIPKPWSAA